MSNCCGFHALTSVWKPFSWKRGHPCLMITLLHFFFFFLCTLRHLSFFHFAWVKINRMRISHNKFRRKKSLQVLIKIKCLSPQTYYNIEDVYDILVFYLNIMSVKCFCLFQQLTAFDINYNGLLKQTCLLFIYMFMIIFQWFYCC